MVKFGKLDARREESVSNARFRSRMVRGGVFESPASYVIMEGDGAGQSFLSDNHVELSGGWVVRTEPPVK